MPEKLMSTTEATPPGGLPWPETLLSGRLHRRYQRFLAEIVLDTGEMVTAHCANSGSMKACSEPGRPVYLSPQNSPRRKLKYTWEMIDMPDSLVGVNTNIPNRLVTKAVADAAIAELAGYERIRPEVTVGENRSRLDLMLEKTDGKRCYVEIKNCTLVENRIASFPDAVTVRGRKHLRELQELVDQGHRGVIFFLIQRMDAECFRPADSIDPEYGRKLRQAVTSGVEILAYDVNLDLQAITIHRRLPCNL